MFTQPYMTPSQPSAAQCASASQVRPDAHVVRQAHTSVRQRHGLLCTRLRRARRRHAPPSSPRPSSRDAHTYRMTPPSAPRTATLLHYRTEARQRLRSLCFAAAAQCARQNTLARRPTRLQSPRVNIPPSRQPRWRPSRAMGALSRTPLRNCHHHPSARRTCIRHRRSSAPL